MSIDDLLSSLTQTPRLQAFTRLRANIKGPIDIVLAPCTAVVGRNKSRKTSVLDTIRLGITGKHPVGGHASDLAELLPPGAEEMTVQLSGPSGTAFWELQAPGGKARKPGPPQYTGDIGALSEDQRTSALTLSNVSEMMSKFGSKRMRAALIRRFAVLVEIPTPVGLSTAQIELWKRAVQATTPAAGDEEADLAEQLAAMTDWFGKRTREHDTKARAIQESIDRAQQQVSTAGVGAELLNELTRRLKQAEAWERTHALRAKRADVLTRITNFEALLTSATADLEAARVAVPPDSSAALAKADRNVAVLEGMLKLVQQSATPICPICTRDGFDALAAFARVDTLLKKLQGTLAELVEHDRVRNVAQQHLQESTKRQAAVESGLSTLRAELAALEIGLADVPEVFTGLTVAQLRAQIDQIKDVDVLRRRVLADTEEMYQLQRQSEACKVLERESAKVQKELLREVQSLAEATVNKYMPPDFRAALVIADKAIEWRSIGSDGRPHKRGGMSGSEFGALLVAIACAWTEDAPLRMMLLDDVDLGVFDPDNLTALLNALSAAVTRGDLTQCIVAWSRPAEIPAGWHIVRQGEA